MSFLTRATVAAFFMFALLSAVRAQAPVQTSSQATGQPPNDDFYSSPFRRCGGPAGAICLRGPLLSRPRRSPKLQSGSALV